MKKLRKLKKGLAILLTAAMVVGLVPNAGVMKASATETYDENGFAADGSYQPATDNDSDGVYEIGNAGQLYWFAALVNGDTTVSGVTAANTAACAELVNDITVNDHVLNDDGTLVDNTSNFRSWTPIGSTFAGRYTGKFDGKGHTISGLYLINESTGSYTYVGLFGVTAGSAVITNLGVVDSYFAGKSYVGGVCARQSGGTLSNCYNAGSVCGLASNSQAGGVCGDSACLKHCYNRGKVWGLGEVGSLIGTNSSTNIENCYYLEGTAEKGVGSSPNVDVSSCVVGKNAEQFKSGEVTYLLNQSTSSGNLAWYQNIEGDAKDDFPVLDSNHGTVYQVTGKDNQITYSNQAPCQHEEYNNGICTSCGTFEEPAKSDEIYKIANYGNLLWFANEVNRGSTAINAELTCDITANASLIGDNGSVTEAPEYIWTPIGNATNNYTGKFDGKGRTISGLYVKSTTGYVGLFGRVKNAEISNVGIVDSYFDGAVYVGGICGYGVSITITNCYSTGEVRSSGSNSYVGGICGDCIGSPGSPVTITNCYNIGEVSGSGDYVGGVCGSSSSNCVISNCYYLVGMPAGSNTAAQTDMFECSISQFASGEVAYRLQGEQEGTVWGQTLTGDNRQYYPVLGGAKVYATTGCVTYNNSGTSAKNHNKENGICKDCGAYDEATDSDGDGYYEIGNAGKLYWFAQQINSGNNNNINAVLTADITVNKGENTGDVANCNGTKADGWIDWVPIGDNATGYVYTGIFDGKNHTVSGLYFNDTSTSNIGLFGDNTGTIKNVGVVDSYFNGEINVGGVCGVNEGNATITNCYNTGTVGGKKDVGGVCGWNINGTIENCYNTGQVSGTTSIGGVCGYNYGWSTIKNCYNTGKVSGTTNIGGVCGYNESNSNSTATITNCYYDSNAYIGDAIGSDEDTSTNVEGKSTDEFKSGQVAYLLNGSKSSNSLVWYQNLGEGGDAFPVLDNTHGVVYQCTGCTGAYSNTENQVAEHTDKDLDGKCDACDVDFKTFEQLGNLIIKVNQNLSDGKYAEVQYTTASIDNLRKALVAANAITAESSETAVTEAYDNLLEASTVGENGLIAADHNIVISFADTGAVRGIAEGNGWYANGDTVTLKVTPSVGYTFSKWTTDTAGGTSVGTESTYTFTLTADSPSAYYAWLDEVKYTVTCGSAEGGTCSTDAAYGKYVYGQTAKVTATAAENYAFVGWKDSYGTTVSTDNIYSFTVLGNTTLTPEFVKVKTDEGADIAYVTVSFYHQSGKLLDSQKVLTGEGKITTTVNAPTKAGFDFLGWSTKASGATAENVIDFSTTTFSEDTSLYPVFAAQNITYTLTVDLQTEQKAPQSSVTVTADPIEGKQFVGWKNADGNIVSYDSTYTFIITGDTTLTSYYEPISAVIEKTPTISMSAPIGSVKEEGISKKATMYFNYEIPENYTLTDIGVIYISGEVEELDINTTGAVIRSAKSTIENTSNAAKNQFYYSKTVLFGQSYTFVGYITYTDATGRRITVYSNLCSTNYQGL